MHKFRIGCFSLGDGRREKLGMTTITREDESRKDGTPNPCLSKTEELRTFPGSVRRFRLRRRGQVEIVRSSPPANPSLYETLPTFTLLVVPFRGGRAVADLRSARTLLGLAAWEA